ncbi:MAG TPA: hypothetical protein VIZ28_16205 [Chitinophagaceae bacterium]
MRSLIFLLLLLPALADAQINRSAKELAGETIEQYIVNKLFKNKQYKPVSYGEIKPVGDKRSKIAWVIDHQFEITEGGEASFERPAKIQQPYKFLFYMDEKMKVVKAVSYYTH